MVIDIVNKNEIIKESASVQLLIHLLAKKEKTHNKQKVKINLTDL